MRGAVWALSLLVATPVAAASTRVVEIEQRVQETLAQEGVSLARHGYALQLTQTASTTVVVRLLPNGAQEGKMRIVEDVPESVDDAVQEIGLVVVSLLPSEHTHGPAPAPPRDVATKSIDTPATDASPAGVKTGAPISEGDRYYLGLAFSWAIGFGSGQFIAGAPRGWLYAILDVLGAGVTTTGVVLFVNDDTRERLGIGLMIGGAAGLFLSRVFQVIDLLAFGADTGALAVMPLADGDTPAVGWALTF
ncbi:MAG: hypothetical protein RMA76_21945 [Deltaproteobacteria bacterium]|jgi:hypothetical protein